MSDSSALSPNQPSGSATDADRDQHGATDPGTLPVDVTRPTPDTETGVPAPPPVADLADGTQDATPEDTGGEDLDQLNQPRTLEKVVSVMPSWLTSLVVHMVILTLLAITTYAIPTHQVLDELTFGTAATDSEEPDFLESPQFNAPLEDDAATTSDTVPSELLSAMPEVNLDAEPVLVDPITSFNPLDVFNPTEGDMNTVAGADPSESLRGRTAADKLRLLREGGGTAGSEAAVKNALVWFKNHQNRDGSWSFRMLGGACNCPDAGEFESAYIAATAMALLPYMGAGHTHQQGAYKDVVRRGLYYLRSRQQVNGSLYESGGRMYSHGLASIALCEAYAMTKDPEFARPAQAALNFIAYAQDPVGGGWRYEVQQPGDTSVVGWQLMALKSGHMGHLQILPVTLQRATKFLDSVQLNGGAGYGYLSPGDKNSTTAIGLLCRMYLGWSKDNEALKRGVENLSQSGPSENDMYYNYYATQVMRHYGGPHWEKWNSKMRDWLVETQAKRGHQAGSWHMGANNSAKAGGRLYSTSMATMILEVYYRHMPIYQTIATDDFEL